MELMMLKKYKDLIDYVQFPFLCLLYICFNEESLYHLFYRCRLYFASVMC
jgi:hypothetical protein